MIFPTKAPFIVAFRHVWLPEGTVIPLGIATSSQSPQFYHGNSDDLNPHNQRMVGFDRESQPMDSMDHDSPPLYPRI